MITILLVDDHKLVRTAIKLLLKNIPDVEIIGEAANGEEAVQLAKKLTPNLVLMDLKMPGIGGLEATNRILNYNPEIRIMILSSCIEEVYIPTHMMKLGAAGYITKNADINEFITAIHKVHSGASYIAPEVAQRIALNQANNLNTSPLTRLSKREIQIMWMVMEGTSVHEIAKKLFLSPKTVNTYRYRTFEKLQIKNNVQLMHLIYHYKMLDHKQSISHL